MLGALNALHSPTTLPQARQEASAWIVAFQQQSIAWQVPELCQLLATLLLSLSPAVSSFASRARAHKNSQMGRRQGWVGK